MCRILYLLFLFSFLSRGLYAQQEEKNISILLLPYPPEFYLSDAERDIVKQSNRSSEECQTYFRKTLDLKIQAELEALGPCVSMLQDTTAKGRKLLEQFYEKTAYFYSDPVGPRVQNEPASQKKNKTGSGIFGTERTLHSTTNGAESQFMKAENKDTVFLAGLAQLSQTNLFICINQFEFKTNYNSCIDIGNNIHQRELIIHYSVFKRDGKQILGNYLREVFPSNESRDREIAERLFPSIAARLKNELNMLASAAP